MRTIRRNLLKILVGAAIGAGVGAPMAGWLVLGQGVVILAILGALAFASLGTLYDPNLVVHSYPSSRGDTSPYKRDD